MKKAPSTRETVNLILLSFSNFSHCKLEAQLWVGVFILKQSPADSSDVEIVGNIIPHPSGCKRPLQGPHCLDTCFCKESVIVTRPHLKLSRCKSLQKTKMLTLWSFAEKCVEVVPDTGGTEERNQPLSLELQYSTWSKANSRLSNFPGSRVISRNDCSFS